MDIKIKLKMTALLLFLIMTFSSIYILLIHENDQENFNEGRNNYERYYLHTSVDILYNITNLSIDNIFNVFEGNNITIIKLETDQFFINFTKYWKLYREINLGINEKHLRTYAFLQDENIFRFYFDCCSEENVIENSSDFYNVTERDRQLLEELVEIIRNIFQEEFGLPNEDINYCIRTDYPDIN